MKERKRAKNIMPHCLPIPHTLFSLSSFPPARAKEKRYNFTQCAGRTEAGTKETRYSNLEVSDIVLAVITTLPLTLLPEQLRFSHPLSHVLVRTSVQRRRHIVNLGTDLIPQR